MNKSNDQKYITVIDMLLVVIGSLIRYYILNDSFKVQDAIEKEFYMLNESVDIGENKCNDFDMHPGWSFKIIDSEIYEFDEFCKKYNLKTVLDLHKTCGYSFDSYGESESGFFDSEQLQERFYCLWEEFAKRYGIYSDRLIFELLNEVTDKSYIDAWNRISCECIKHIRKYAPDTLILVGSYDNNGVAIFARII